MVLIVPKLQFHQGVYRGLPWETLYLQRWLNNKRMAFSWYLYKFVAQNMLHIFLKKKGSFPKKEIEFDDSFDVTKCFQQIEIPDLLHMCAPCSELSSNILTMALGTTERFPMTKDRRRDNLNENVDISNAKGFNYTNFL